jgi:hypothetical protein
MFSARRPSPSSSHAFRRACSTWVGHELLDPSLDRRRVVIGGRLGAVELGQPHRADCLSLALGTLDVPSALPGREEGGVAIEVAALDLEPGGHLQACTVPLGLGLPTMGYARASSPGCALANALSLLGPTLPCHLALCCRWVTS